MTTAQKSLSRLAQTLNQAVVGQEHVVDALIISLLSSGHVLLEGLPGTAKTRSVKALADALNISFGRIQFTPDLLPSDVTGSEVYQENNGKPQLSFKPGPIFNSVVLADEINRAPAKVQAALLEAMAEGTLTAAGETYTLPHPFIVLATQNPIEQEGTYPLPEAQLDRFFMKVDLEYPDVEAELNIIRLVRHEDLYASSKEKSTNQPIDLQHIIDAKQQIKALYISESIERYLVDIINATRSPKLYPNSSLSRWIEVGASPRATISLDRAARARAWLVGRDFVTPDDVRATVHSILSHRISLSFEAISDGVTSKNVVDEILHHVLLT